VLDDIIEIAGSALFDAAIDRRDDRSGPHWAALFLGTIFGIGSLGLLATGRFGVGVAALFVGGVLFGWGM